MLWRTLFCLYLCFGLLYILSIILCVSISANRFRKKHPDIKLPKSSPAEVLMIAIKTILVALIPVVNIVLSMGVIIFYDATCDSAVEEIERKNGIFADKT